MDVTEEPVEHGVRCRTCGEATEDLTAAPVGACLPVWCHRCETVTDQEVVW